MPEGWGKFDLIRQPAVVEHGGLEVIVVIEEKESLFEVDNVVRILEVGKSLGVLGGEVGKLVVDVDVGHSVGNAGQRIVPNLVSIRRSSSRFCPGAWRGREAAQRRRLSNGIRVGSVSP